MSKYPWIHIKVRIHPGMTPTEKAVFHCFCSETFIRDGKLYGERSIQAIAIPYNLKNLVALRAWRKMYCSREQVLL